MKKSFTLMELIVVIVIISIISNVSIEILQKVFYNYITTKKLNELSTKADIALNIISANLKNSVKNSIIAVECNASLPVSEKLSCESDFKKNYIPIEEINSLNSYRFNVIEWLYVSVYSKKGMWSEAKKAIQPGWSGFVDLKKTLKSGTDEYNITSEDSNFTIVKAIDEAWFNKWNVSVKDIFKEEFDVLIFGGSDAKGDIEDINDSYGYYQSEARKVFAINQISDTRINIKAFSESNLTDVYEKYYIVRSAMAVVPVYNAETKDYNLTLRFNYFPWKKQTYIDANASLIIDHVKEFSFKKENGVIKLHLCIHYMSLNICKEKALF